MKEEKNEEAELSGEISDDAWGMDDDAREEEKKTEVKPESEDLFQQLIKQEPAKVDIMDQIMPKSRKEEVELRGQPEVNNTQKISNAPTQKERKVVVGKKVAIAVQKAVQSDDSDEFKDVQQPETTDKEIESLVDLIPSLRPSLQSKTICENKGQKTGSIPLKFSVWV